MGLDMYLYLEKYQSKFHTDDTTGFYPPELRDIQAKQEARNFLSKMTKYQVGYWRKANHIHRFFVEKCKDGEDDCRPIYIHLSQLKELKKICEQVLANHDLAEVMLPTQEGFFFGDTEYGEYYFDDVTDTLDIITPIIDFLEKENNSSWACYYEASW